MNILEISIVKNNIQQKMSFNMYTDDIWNRSRNYSFCHSLGQKNEVKRSFACNLLEPDFIYLDPRVTLTAPKELTIFCAMDACSHALESLWNKNMTDISFKYAIESLKLISCNLMPLLNDLNNVCYRAKIQLSSFYSGCAIRITRTAIAHSISYPITLKYNVPHGLACSFTLKK